MAGIDAEESGEGSRHQGCRHRDGRQRIGCKGGIAGNGLSVEFFALGRINVNIPRGDGLQGHPDGAERRSIDGIHVGPVLDGQLGDAAGNVIAVAIPDGELTEGQLVSHRTRRQFRTRQGAIEPGIVERAGNLAERTVLLVVQFIEIPVTVPQSHRGRIDILHKTVCLGIGKRDSDFGRFPAVGDILSGKRYVNFTVAINRLVHHGNLLIRDERLRATSVQRTGRCTAVQADGHGPDQYVTGGVLGLLNLFGDVLFFRTAPHHGTCQNKDGHAQVSHCLFHLALRLAGHYHVNSGCWL